jgi:hypothetical protein
LNSDVDQIMLKGKWQYIFLFSRLKEHLKPIETLLPFFSYLAYFSKYFNRKKLIVRHLGFL